MDHIALADLSFKGRRKGAGSFYSGLYYPRKKAVRGNNLVGEPGNDRQTVLCYQFPVTGYVCFHLGTVFMERCVCVCVMHS